MNSDIKKYHRKHVLTKDNKIGICYLWEWKGVFLYAGEGISIGYIEYPLTAFDINDLIEINIDKFNDLYNKRNIMFTGIPNSRVYQYGLIHDQILNATHEVYNGIQTYWSKSFCVSYSSMVANEKVFDDCIKIFGNFDINYLLKNHNDKYKRIICKHKLNNDNIYSLTMDDIMDGKLNIDEVKNNTKHLIKKLPSELHSIYGEEMNYYLINKNLKK
jgi:hypothetical protein